MTDVHNPVGIVDTVPDFIDPVQGLLALHRAGYSTAYTTWATDPARTFEELAFIDKAKVWRRNDPVLLAGAAALNITNEQLDQLFLIAANIKI